jgi:hypothetical protein
LVAGAKAKTVTNNLPLLSVLGLGGILKLSGCDEFVLLILCLDIQASQTGSLFCSFWFGAGLCELQM